MAADNEPIAKLRASINVLSSLSEIRKLMLESGVGSDSEDMIEIQTTVADAMEQGDSARSVMLKKGNLSTEDSSTILSYTRMRRDILKEH